MKIEIVYWCLQDKYFDLDVLRKTIDEKSLSNWRNVDALNEKIWVENEKEGWWGAIMIWDGEKPDLCDLPANVSRDILQRAPDFRMSFDINAIARKAKCS